MQASQSDKSVICWEEPDICFVRFIGDVSEALMRRLLADQMAMVAGRPYHFHLLDLSQAGHMSAEARHVAREITPGPELRGTAIFGASWKLRALATIFNRAVNLLQGYRDNPQEFFATESQARAWLAERRRVLAAHRQQ